MNFGYQKSQLDGSELKFQTISNNLPEQLSFIPDLPYILNQMSNPICVPCAISAFIDWKYREDTDTDLFEIFNYKHTNDGMTFKDALYYLRHHGVSTKEGNFKIKQYAMIGSIPVLQTALVMNGPCIIGVPVRNSSIEHFWNGTSLEGGHALAVVGYDKQGFILRNSWGFDYGTNGYTHMDYKDFDNIYEIWTMIC